MMMYQCVHASPSSFGKKATMSPRRSTVPSIGYCERAWTKYQRRPHRRKYAGDGWLSDVEADETTASARLQGGLHVGNGAEIPARRFTDSGRTYPEAVSVHAPHTEALF